MLKRIFQYAFNRSNKQRIKFSKKIFCIGQNKTGTTSLKKTFEKLGYFVGNQHEAELLLPYFKSNDFSKIINYCHSAQVFQDFPFSYHPTYKYLDQAFPGSKFILTIRNSADEWYNSLTNFHAKLFGNGKIPSPVDLQNTDYVSKGWVWECNRAVYNTPDHDPYNKEILINHYNNYNEEVISYFKDKPDDLLVINLSEKGSFRKFCDFLKIETDMNDFPWENKTSELRI